LDCDLILDIIKANIGDEIDEPLADGLYEMCDSFHSSCDSSCLMISQELVRRKEPESDKWSPFVAANEDDREEGESTQKNIWTIGR